MISESERAWNDVSILEPAQAYSRVHPFTLNPPKKKNKSFDFLIIVKSSSEYFILFSSEV